MSTNKYKIKFWNMYMIITILELYYFPIAKKRVSAQKGPNLHSSDESFELGDWVGMNDAVCGRTHIGNSILKYGVSTLEAVVSDPWVTAPKRQVMSWKASCNRTPLFAPIAAERV